MLLSRSSHAVARATASVWQPVAPEAPELWTAEERAWAKECFASGDDLREIADTAERALLDVACALGVQTAVRQRVWRQSQRRGGSQPSAWCGRMLKAVALDRYGRGESIRTLAAEAGVTAKAMWHALKKHRESSF